MNNKLNEIRDNIKQFNKNAVFDIIKNKNLQKPLLLSAFRTSKYRILLFDETMGLQPIAEISYAKNANHACITVFEVQEDFQQKGLGRFLLNLVSTHCDILGLTGIHGQANPTNNIKGISDRKGITFKDEQLALIEIYKKLGCNFANDNNFEQNWKPGEKIEKADHQLLDLAYKIAEQDGFSKPKQML